MKPLISVIIPTYNRGMLIGETIQSVLDQTYRNWELIIVDDGSEDNTETVVANYKDVRIHYIKISHSGIFGFVRNQGIKISMGELIAFLDSDDLWKKDKLEFQVSLLLQNSKAMFAFSNIDIIGESKVVTPDYENVFVGNVLLPVLEERRFVFYPSCLIFKRSILNTTGLMNETLSSGSDMNFFFAMSARFIGIFTNRRLTKIRKHAGGTSDFHGALPFMDGIFNIESLHHDGFLTDSENIYFVSKNYYRMGLFFLHKALPIQARNSFLKYARLRPFHWKGWVRLAQSLLRGFLKV